MIPQRVLVTGSSGFVGERLVRTLLADARFAAASLLLFDVAPSSLSGPRVTSMCGDLGDDAVRAILVAERPDLVFHLAGVLGGAAEANYDAGRRINLDATMSLLEGLREVGDCPRVVFASSIAVFGPPLPPIVTDATEPRPLMNYGAQKRMIEVALEQFSARGWLDAISLRLPGIVARPGADARLKSAFLNALFYAARDGEPFTLPVSATGTTWLLSVGACVEALLHAALLPSVMFRTLTLPAQCVAFGDLVEILGDTYPQSVGRIAFAPDDSIEAQFGRQPPLETAAADAAGFRHDGDLATLIERALAE